MQLELFSNSEKYTLTEEIFIAYYACRKNKRNTLNALRFEKNFEHNLFVLHDEILNVRNSKNFEMNEFIFGYFETL